MGGDDSQKLLPWRGVHSSPGRKPPAQLRNQQCSGKLRGGELAGHGPRPSQPRFVAQLPTAWVILRKQTWVTSAARRSEVGETRMARLFCVRLSPRTPQSLTVSQVH
jgi:hypothetical protein